MKYAAIIACAVLAAGSVAAETVRSKTYEATAQRRAVTMKSQSGKSLVAQQVLIVVKRLDGKPAGDAALAFAEKVACKGGKPVVSLALGATPAGTQFEILCRSGA